MAALSGAVTAFEENESLNELLIGTLAKLVCVLNNEGSKVTDRAIGIIRANATE